MSELILFKNQGLSVAFILLMPHSQPASWGNQTPLVKPAGNFSLQGRRAGGKGFVYPQ